MRVDHNYEQLLWSEVRKPQVFRSLIKNKPKNMQVSFDWELKDWDHHFDKIPHYEELVKAGGRQKYWVECPSNPLPPENTSAVDVTKGNISIKGWIKHIDENTFSVYSTIGSNASANRPTLMVWDSASSSEEAELVHKANSSLGVNKRPIAHYRNGRLYCVVCTNAIVAILPSLRDILLAEITEADLEQLRNHNILGFLTQEEMANETLALKGYTDFLNDTCTTIEMKIGLKQVVDKRQKHIEKFMRLSKKDQEEQFSFMRQKYAEDKKHQTKAQALVGPTDYFFDDLRPKYIGKNKILVSRENKECLSFFIFFFNNVFATDNTTKEKFIAPHPKK